MKSKKEFKKAHQFLEEKINYDLGEETTMSLSFDFMSEEYLTQIKGFDCGNDAVNEFLREHAFELHSCNYCITKLFFKDDTLVGFISARLGEASVDQTNITRLGWADRLPHTAYYARSYPIIHIQFLGVDQSFKRQGIARIAVTEVLKKAYKIQQELGCNFVYLDSYLTDEALGLYKSLGFQEIDRDEDANSAKMLFIIS